MYFNEHTKWEFGDAGWQTFGLSDAAVTTFAKKSSLGRESAQNALGARHDKNKPVRVVYKAIRLEKSQIPGRINLRNRLEKCKQEYEGIEHESTGGEIDILNEAIECLEQEKIECLLVSDFNTKGLAGEDSDPKGNFRRFIMQGISVAMGDSPGSFGQGKNALFIASSTRSIYITSTLAEPIGEQKPYLEFGVARLCTHCDPEDSSKRCEHIGYLSNQTEANDRYVHPFRYSNPASRPSYVQDRTEPGTDILLIGHKNAFDLNWRAKLASDLIEAFFLSILDEKIIFEITGNDGQSLFINKETLVDTIEAIQKLATEGPNSYLTKRQFSELPIANVRGQIKATNEGISFTKSLEALQGNIEIKVFSDKDDEELTNKSSIHRNPGMTIMHTGKGRTKLKHFNCTINVTSDNREDKQDANYYMVQMEDPTHTQLDVDNIRDKRVKKTKAQNLKTEINNFLVECLESFHKQDDFGDDVPGLSRYLPCIDLEECNPDQEKGVTLQELEENSKSVDPFTDFAEETTNYSSNDTVGIERKEAAELDQTGFRFRKTSGKKSKSKGGRSSTGRRTDAHGRQSESSNMYLTSNESCDIRIVCPSSDFSEYRILISTKSYTKGNLMLKVVGEDSNKFDAEFLLKAWQANNKDAAYTTNGNCIEDIEVQPGKTLAIDFSTKFNVPIAFDA